MNFAIRARHFQQAGHQPGSASQFYMGNALNLTYILVLTAYLANDKRQRRAH